MKRPLILSFLLIAAIPGTSFGWGKIGHGIVAEIAFSMLDEHTKTEVTRYLGTTTIEGASTWMDEVRNDHTYDYMKPWHYVNIEKGAQYMETTDGNIVNALSNAIRELEHRNKLSSETIKQDLMIIFHLTGDLHMPLHIGYATDKGGNTIQVNYLGRKANLHWVWDNELIESEKISLNDCLAQLKTLKKADIDNLRRINVTEWINEPRSLLDNVYAYKDETIDQVYVDKNKPVVEKQLLIAGIRLAAVLEHIFKS